MKTVSTSEAKARLSSLLAQVERGEEITITRQGRPVARLVPIAAAQQHHLEEVTARLKAFRFGRRLGDVTVKELVEEGRR